MVDADGLGQKVIALRGGNQRERHFVQIAPGGKRSGFDQLLQRHHDLALHIRDPLGESIPYCGGFATVPRFLPEVMRDDQKRVERRIDIRHAAGEDGRDTLTRGMAAQQRDEIRLQPAPDLAHRLGPQRVGRGEMMVDLTGRTSQILGDASYRGGCQALLRDEVNHRVHDLLSPRLT